MRLVPAWPATRRVRIARIVAASADLLQLAFFPYVLPGVLSPLDDAIDVVVALLLVWLVGWHLAFLPALAAEMVPGVDLVPTWTAAVWLATRKGVPERSGPRVEPAKPTGS
jgi:hypothetical protein